MQGIGYTLSRLPNARAFLAGAAIVVGAFASAAHGQASGAGSEAGAVTADAPRAEEGAWALSRSPHGGPVGVVFPRPLRPGDVAVMRHIFAAERRGDIAESIRSTADLDDPLLLGNVLADRYLGRVHRSTSDELASWLERYRELPDALAIHALLLTKLPKGAAAPPAPEAAVWTQPADPGPPPDGNELPRNPLVRQPMLDRSVLDRAGRGDTASALRLIGRARGIPIAYAAQLRAEVAQVAFTRNDDAGALHTAQLALQEVAPEQQPGLAFYVGGLAAWRLERIEQARALFEGGAKAVNTLPRLRAASAFWASRANRNMHDGSGTVKWLRVAAEQQPTFHGLLARRILRMDSGIRPSGAMLSQADVDAVAATPAGWRAFALMQVGQATRADAELRGLWSEAQANPAFGRSLLMVASAAGLTDCAALISAIRRSAERRAPDSMPPDGMPSDAMPPDAVPPDARAADAGLADAMVADAMVADAGRRNAEPVALPRLRPAGGFTVDPTLVYAVARTESNSMQPRSRPPERAG